jgi:H+/Cl- antiporter ClcA
VPGGLEDQPSGPTRAGGAHAAPARAADLTGAPDGAGRLGDFTVTPRVLPIAALAIGIGLLSAYVALALLQLIGLFTNLFFFHRWATALVSPADSRIGPLTLLVPVSGALVIGLMARYGSEKIRGHGIPEAIESILIHGSRVEPKLAVLKPLSAAISIGSGGPFGAEGPIIMTGGAFGSMVAQFFHLTAAERKTLLVAGAAGGMSATFASPVAAVLLAVELLLFEWKPRSLIPVALSSAAAAATRVRLMGPGPLFPSPPHAIGLAPAGVAGCVIVGLVPGALAALLTVFVYAAEDAFRRLPIHWAWWPAIGGLVIGLGGLVLPQALGVGYDTIGAMIQGSLGTRLVLGILLVKSTIWAVSLGSGTSGGVLAPLLMMGGAAGALAGGFLPFQGHGFWALLGMGAIMGGVMRSPFTGMVFAVELTHDLGMLFPLMIAVMVAYGFTVLVMRRSILTEKVARRGYHLTREYACDPLELLFVREVMRSDAVALPGTLAVRDLPPGFDARARGQRLYPVVTGDGILVGVLRRRQIEELRQDAAGGQGGRPLAEVLHRTPVVAHPDEPLRTVVYRMAATGLTQFPVVERGARRRLVGIVTLSDLLAARQRHLEEEQRRERVLRVRLSFPLGRGPRDAVPTGGAR